MNRVLLVADGAPRFAELAEGLPREPGDIRILWLGPGGPPPDLSSELERRRWRVVPVADAARLLAEETEALRPALIRWACDLGDARVEGCRVKEHLIIPGQGWSAWWAGLLSEKNTLKTPLFFRLIELAVARKLMARGERCLFAVREPAFAESLGLAAAAIGAPFVLIPVRGMRGTTGHPVLRGAVTAVSLWMKTLWRRLYLRSVRGAPSHRAAGCAANLMVSYFPLVDRVAAAEGRYVNRYAAPLQDLARRSAESLSWLLIYVPIEGWSFRQAVGLARRFSDESLFFWEEFLGWRDLLAAPWLWLRGAWAAERLVAKIDDRTLAPEEMGPAAGPLARTLWRLSFFGPAAMEGVLFYPAFAAAFRCLPRARRCVYLCEMMAWEKALNAAKRRCRPDIRTVAFPHSTLCRNFLNYYYDRRELVREGTDADLPLPDIMAAGGRLLAEELRRAGYPAVRIVESLRYLYINRLLAQPQRHPEGQRRLLVVGSIDREETAAILRLAVDAFPAGGSVSLSFIAHPVMPVSALGTDLPAGIEVAREILLEELARSACVLVGASTVAVEALAHGCAVLEPVFAHVMRMNPLSDHPDFCRPVYSCDDLRKAASSDFGMPEPEAARRFVRDYWELDESLPRWRALLFGPEGESAPPLLKPVTRAPEVLQT